MMPNSASSLPETYTLNLAFDVLQISTALRFDILVNGQSAMQTEGRNAGAYCLQPGDQLTIEVAASFDPTGSMTADDITIEDLTLVCLPAGHDHQPHLSPYDSKTAGFVLKAWERLRNSATDRPATQPAAEPPGTGDGVARFRFVKPKDIGQENGLPLPVNIDGTLPVNVDGGQWQISGFLSVEFPGEKEQRAYRVYGFDPVVVVGNGWNPPVETHSKC